MCSYCGAQHQQEFHSSIAYAQYHCSAGMKHEAWNVDAHTPDTTASYACTSSLAHPGAGNIVAITDVINSTLYIILSGKLSLSSLSL